MGITRACTRNSRDMTRAFPHARVMSRAEKSDAEVTAAKKSKNLHVNSRMHCRVHFLFLEQ